MVDGIIQKATDKYINAGYPTDPEAYLVRKLMKELQQELIEKIKQNSIGLSIVKLEKLIGDNKDGM